MGKKIKGLLWSFGVSVFIVLFASMFIFTSSQSPDEVLDAVSLGDASLESSLEKYGDVCVVTTAEFSGRKTTPGVWIDELVGCDSNLAVDMGLNATRDILGQGTQFGAFDWVALNNASIDGSEPAATDVAFAGEWTTHNLSRAQATYATVDTTPGTWTLEYTFTSNQSTGLTTNKSCIFNQSSGGTMLACNTFSDITMNGVQGDRTTVTWTNNVTSG